MDTNFGPQLANTENKPVAPETMPQPVVPSGIQVETGMAPEVQNPAPAAANPEGNTQTVIQPAAPVVPEIVAAQPIETQEISLDDPQQAKTEPTPEQIQRARKIIETHEIDMASLAEDVANLQTPEMLS